MKLFVVTLLVGLMSVIMMASSQNDCKGQVGNYTYDLTPLVLKLKSQGQGPPQVWDQFREYFTYGVCGYWFWMSPYDVKAMVWLRNTHSADPIDYWLQRTAIFKPLSNGTDADGFTLFVGGGGMGSAVTIAHKCDWGVEDGVFSYVGANTTGGITYNLQYLSKYACPTNAGPTPSPSPSPSLPPREANQCCLYQLTYDTSNTKTLCAAECPAFVGSYSLVYNWTLSPCTSDTCFFHK